MDFEQVVRARRMTRRFRPDLPVPAGTLEELVALA